MCAGWAQAPWPAFGISAPEFAQSLLGHPYFFASRLSFSLKSSRGTMSASLKALITRRIAIFLLFHPHRTEPPALGDQEGNID